MPGGHDRGRRKLEAMGIQADILTKEQEDYPASGPKEHKPLVTRLFKLTRTALILGA